MKKWFIVPALCCMTMFVSCRDKSECDTNKDCSNIENIDRKKANVSAEDLAGISKACDLYVKAAVEGNSNVARPAFVEGATISHVEGDSIIILPIQDLFDYYDQTGKQPASYEIADCNVTGNIAMIRIESVFGDAKFSDIFTLAKSGDEWKIVSKIFTVK